MVRKKYTRKRKMKYRKYLHGAGTGDDESKKEKKNKIETKEEYGDELWQIKEEEPHNLSNDAEYEKKWGFKWVDRMKYSSDRRSHITKKYLNPTVIRTGEEESQLKASKRYVKEMEGNNKGLLTALAYKPYPLKRRSSKISKGVMALPTNNNQRREALKRLCLHKLLQTRRHPFQNFLINRILLCKNATDLKNIFKEYNDKIDAGAKNGPQELFKSGKNSINQIFVDKKRHNLLQWRNENDVKENLKLLRQTLSILKKCLFWKAVMMEPKNNRGSPVWTHEWKQLLGRFRAIEFFFKNNSILIAIPNSQEGKDNTLLLAQEVKNAPVYVNSNSDYPYDPLPNENSNNPAYYSNDNNNPPWSGIVHTSSKGGPSGAAALAMGVGSKKGGTRKTKRKRKKRYKHKKRHRTRAKRRKKKKTRKR